jgi:hypothetical protein
MLSVAILPLSCQFSFMNLSSVERGKKKGCPSTHRFQHVDSIKLALSGVVILRTGGEEMQEKVELNT